MENMFSVILEKPWIIISLLLWMIPWKGWALWRSARNGHMGWFVVLLIVNTLAILEIIYIFFVSQSKTKKEDPSKNRKIEIKIAQNLQKPKLTV